MSVFTLFYLFFPLFIFDHVRTSHLQERALFRLPTLFVHLRPWTSIPYAISFGIKVIRARVSLLHFLQSVDFLRSIDLQSSSLGNLLTSPWIPTSKQLCFLRIYAFLRYPVTILFFSHTGTLTFTCMHAYIWHTFWEAIKKIKDKILIFRINNIKLKKLIPHRNSSTVKFRREATDRKNTSLCLLDIQQTSSYTRRIRNNRIANTKRPNYSPKIIRTFIKIGVLLWHRCLLYRPISTSLSSYFQATSVIKEEFLHTYILSLTKIFINISTRDSSIAYLLYLYPAKRICR